MTAVKTLDTLVPAEKSTIDVSGLGQKCYEAMNDDINTPIVIAHLFEGVRIINLVNDGRESLAAADINLLKELFKTFVFDILGLKAESAGNDEKLAGVVTMLLDIRQEAKANREWAVSDRIRDRLGAIGIIVKDRKDGYDWEIAP
jgi:cysteinyl-tRNA synthetase